MAVDSKNGENGTSTAARRKRPSSLMANASALPTVESSLEEFIARANQTLVDASTWDQAEKTAKQEDDKRREADQQRWKAAEHQMRESQARETALRRQLDGLQGKLAEAEARAAVATSANHDGVVADLQVRLSQTDGALQEAQARTLELEESLIAAKSAAARASEQAARASEQAAVVRPSAPAVDSAAADDRVRLAEAKAAKALAAAKAAAAGLTVSPADLAAIESGLVVPQTAQPSQLRWVWVLVAFAAGIAIMFAMLQVLGNKDGKDTAEPKTAAQPAPVSQPAAQPAVAPTPAPKATPPKSDDKKSGGLVDPF